MIRTLGRFATVLVILSSITGSATAAPVTTIGFDELTAGPFVSFAQSGFDVEVVSGIWEVETGFGKTKPFILFRRSEGLPITAAVEITAGGALFAFHAVDLYSSVTKIPYEFSGFLDSAPMFVTTGLVPHTFGAFATRDSDSTLYVDRLRIVLSNTECGIGCRNPMGLDNIVVSRVPEPSALLMLVGAISVVAARRKRA